MNKIISELVSFLKKELRKVVEIESLTFVGSFAEDKSKKLQKFNDLDFVIICEKVGKKEMNTFKRIVEKTREKFQSEEIGITHTFDIGPTKIKSRKEITLMVHFLVYPSKMYKEYESTQTRQSFQKYRPLYGKSLKEYSEVLEISKADLFNKIDGIPAIKKWIGQRKIEYLQPNEKAYKIKEKKLTNEEFKEIAFYSVLRLSNNILKLKGISLNVNKESCQKFKESVSITLNNLPLQYLKYKNKHRKGICLSVHEERNLQKEVLEFVSQCEEYLNQRKEEQER